MWSDTLGKKTDADLDVRFWDAKMFPPVKLTVLPLKIGLLGPKNEAGSSPNHPFSGVSSFRECYYLPIASMYGIFTYIYHKKQPNVGKYTVRPMDGMGRIFQI